MCIDDPSVISLLSQSSDTSKSIKCYLYENDSDQVVVTFPVEINMQQMVFVFKVYKMIALSFYFMQMLQK